MHKKIFLNISEPVGTPHLEEKVITEDWLGPWRNRVSDQGLKESWFILKSSLEYRK